MLYKVKIKQEGGNNDDDEFNIDEEDIEDEINKEDDEEEFNSKQSVENAVATGGATEEYKVIKLQ